MSISLPGMAFASPQPMPRYTEIETTTSDKALVLLDGLLTVCFEEEYPISRGKTGPAVILCYPGNTQVIAVSAVYRGRDAVKKIKANLNVVG